MCGKEIVSLFRRKENYHLVMGGVPLFRHITSVRRHQRNSGTPGLEQIREVTVSVVYLDDELVARRDSGGV